MRLYPFQIHSIALSSFASIMGPMGPFGGFFASGFERAFKIKDFANTIPGLWWHYGPVRLPVPHGHIC
ncbi:hypothetical protein CesoFtcFv8_004209 [Champsocephalus esox]|uniref:phosphatidate cytidylyltransferase n=1 Tax=Champsocephalus esox TaxID=159716 RepID=A0AAN8HBX7_9TELE|nr:hypothetical protein CesoFtcFv8_004209 [Champsocephalus esox]